MAASHLALALLAALLAPASGALSTAPVGTMSPYPGFDGSRVVTATLEMAQMGEYLHLEGVMEGLLPDSTGGIHVHEGFSCEESAGHLVDSNGVDPWATTTYTTDADGKAVPVLVVTGQSLTDVLGRAVVVHAPNGTRILCGLIAEAATTTLDVQANGMDLSTYPGYTGNAVFTSTDLEVSMSGNYVMISGTISSTETDVTGGLHIHEGSTCDTSGPHYFSPITGVDPWIPTKYTTDANGTASVMLLAYGFDDTTNRTVVAHSSTGIRMACSQITVSASSVPADVPTTPAQDNSAGTVRAFAFATFIPAIMYMLVLHA